MSIVQFDLSNSVDTRGDATQYTSASSLSQVLPNSSQVIAAVARSQFRPEPFAIYTDHNAVRQISNERSPHDLPTLRSILETSAIRHHLLTRAETRQAHNLRKVVARASALETSGSAAKAIDTIFQEIDERFRNGQFKECNELLETTDPKCLSARLIVALLSITLAASRELSARRKFYSAARKAILSRGMNPDSVVGGLQGGRAGNAKSLFSGGKSGR
jgi:ribosomal protein L17